MIFQNLFSLESGRPKGFTLIELLVSLGIITIITSVVVFNQNAFTDQVALSNTGSEISLQIREAQTYGVSVREFAPGTSEFNVAYGVSFNLISLSGGSNNSYVYFADRGASANGIYDTPTVCQPGITSECLSRLYVSRGNTITNLCALLSNGTTCTNAGRVDITFLRPYPNARLIFFNISGTQVPFPTAQAAKIELSSPSGKKAYIVIYTTGQVSIQ